MINTESDPPLVPTNTLWDSSCGEPDMKNFNTPLADSILQDYIPSDLRDKIFITNLTPESDFHKYDEHIILKDGHWFAIIKDRIYCSLGKPYRDMNFENETKYLILQSPNSAVCGAYATLFCVSSIRNNDPLQELNIGTECHFVCTDANNFAYDVLHKDVDVRNTNDQMIAQIYNKQRNA
jgi:hypothetical protein